VGLADNFITSGGDSIQILGLLNAIKARFNVDLASQEFVRVPTMTWLCALTCLVWEL